MSVLSNRPATPNHALQRTAPRVTLAAADHPAAFAHPAPRHLRPQPARRAPQSLSLGSFGDVSRLPPMTPCSSSPASLGGAPRCGFCGCHAAPLAPRGRFGVRRLHDPSRVRAFSSLVRRIRPRQGGRALLSCLRPDTHAAADWLFSGPPTPEPFHATQGNAEPSAAANCSARHGSCFSLA